MIFRPILTEGFSINLYDILEIQKLTKTVEPKYKIKQSSGENRFL